MLYILPTPIGNIDDITIRCMKEIQRLSYFICEDTRQTKKLCNLLHIDYSDKQFYSLTSFTSQGKLDFYLDLLQKQDIWLMSDAGTPGLSDPGKALVEICNTHKISFTVLPGTNALVPAVVAAGFDSSKFQFWWFLPKNKGKQTAMREIVSSTCPIFVYESVHRVEKTLRELKALWFVGKVSMAREVSKMHEQLLTGNIDEVLAKIEKKEIVLKGEFVLGFANH